MCMCNCLVVCCNKDADVVSAFRLRFLFPIVCNALCRKDCRERTVNLNFIPDENAKNRFKLVDFGEG